MAEHDDGSRSEPDVLVFRTTLTRMLVTMLLLGVVGWIFARLMVILLFDLGFSEEVIRESLISGVFYVMLFAGLGALGQRRRPTWVRLSGTGIELAAARRQPVFVPWDAVEAVRFRWFGPFTMVEVTPTSMAATSTGPPTGWGPRIRQRAGRPTIVTEVGLLHPGPDVLRAELTRRLPAGVVQPG
ncbi:hypothetical protein [Micromonospora sp. NBC_01796]|uniref:hypothetical protein n=1 Tax=Micromonospora sp. NBC_01796 TaxID=2975987 RepID=UPI002DD8178F|nr:hypothetical protein [Micromonospora sp. NBC_01796]WSA88670.1 hypothetical protein OIE47_14290 [Micromonospora sp. NBC_01796]